MAQPRDIQQGSGVKGSGSILQPANRELGTRAWGAWRVKWAGGTKEVPLAAPRPTQNQVFLLYSR
jgi:hypothetical protein